MLSFYNSTPVLEYGLVNPDVEKHSGSLLFIKDSITDKLKTFTSLNHLNLYIINYKHNIQPFTVIKIKTIK